MQYSFDELTKTFDAESNILARIVQNLAVDSFSIGR